jgi:hypothetical protein
MNVRPRCFLVFAFAALHLQAGDSKACADLVSYPLSGGTIMKSELVQSSSATPENTIAPFCRVAASLKPSPDSDIRMELWLPEDWNGKLEGNGMEAGRALSTHRL